MSTLEALVTRKFRRTLASAILHAVLIGGLTASGLAWAQTSGSPPNSTPIPPAKPRVFFGTSVARIVDTRLAAGTASAGPLGANSKIDVKVAGLGPVPANAAAAAVNVTAFGTDQQSFLTIWPTGQAQPHTSLLNPQPGMILSQGITVGLGTDGQFSIYNAVGATHVVVDLVGYYQNTSDVPSLNGEAHFHTGTGDPTADEGVVGDMYINNTTNTLFGPKTADGWGAGTRLGGGQFSTGTTDPTATQGELGDVYLNTATNTIFGPKAAAGWGTGANLAPTGLSASAASWVPTQNANVWQDVPNAQLTLPPGKWDIRAKGDIDLGGSGQTVDYRLQNITDGTTLDSGGVHAAATAIRSPLTSEAMMSLTVTSTVSFQIDQYGTGTNLTIENVKLFATPLSLINGT